MPVVVAPGLALLTAIQPEMEVTWNQGGVYYAGRIRTITPRDEWRADYIELDIECQDYTSLLNDEICTSARSVVETDAQRISWLLQNFDRRGITGHNVQTLYSNMPTQDFTGLTLTAAITAVLAFSGGAFYVDDFKDLHTFLAENLTAPFSLSDNPDGITSFGYNSFRYPQDSVDLRNAVYAVPGVPPIPTSSDSGTCVITSTSTFGNGVGACIATFRPVQGKFILPVGIGAFTKGGPSSVAPGFSQATQPGNMLTAWVTSDFGDPVCATPGWSKVVSTGPMAFQWQAIWVKANCAANEAPPVFTTGAGTDFMYAQLGEWQNADPLIPVDRNGIATSVVASITVAATGLDTVGGDLIMMVVQADPSPAATATFAETFNNAAAVHVGDSGAAVLISHSTFSYGITANAKPTWYSDAISIAAFGRREASFSASTVTSQPVLDSLGAAYLAAHKNPLQHSSLLLPPGSPAGLTAGMTIPVTNSLYGLSAQPFRVQSVQTSYPADNLPQFGVQFGDSAITLTTQMAKLQSQITAATASPATSTMGTLGFVPSTTISQATIVAQVDLTGLSITVAVGSGRRIRFTAQCSSQATVATDVWYFAILDAAGPTQIQSLQMSPGTTANVVWPPISTVITPTAGSHTYKLVGARQSGTGSFTANSGGGFPAFLLIEDIGT